MRLKSAVNIFKYLWEAKADRAWRKPNSATRPAPASLLLQFTGTCTQAEFSARCREQDYWYHRFHFDNGFVQHGDYDIGRDIADYGFPQDLTGWSVLDVGTGSGWFAVYFEQQGADVTTVDVRGISDVDVFGRSGPDPASKETPAPDRILPDGQPIWYSPSSRGFWIMKDLLGLKAEYVNARIYDLSPELFGGKKFDLIFVGSVLNHLRDPIGALMAVRSVCGGRVIATSCRLEPPEDPLPVMRLIAPQSYSTCWWLPNKSCLVQWFRGAGFTRVEVDRTVQLSTDRPAVDVEGNVTACDQTLYVVEAFV